MSRRVAGEAVLFECDEAGLASRLIHIHLKRDAGFPVRRQRNQALLHVAPVEVELNKDIFDRLLGEIDETGFELERETYSYARRFEIDLFNGGVDRVCGWFHFQNL